MSDEPLSNAPRALSGAEPEPTTVTLPLRWGKIIHCDDPPGMEVHVLFLGPFEVGRVCKVRYWWAWEMWDDDAPNHGRRPTLDEARAALITTVMEAGR